MARICHFVRLNLILPCAYFSHFLHLTYTAWLLAVETGGKIYPKESMEKQTTGICVVINLLLGTELEAFWGTSVGSLNKGSQAISCICRSDHIQHDCVTTTGRPQMGNDTQHLQEKQFTPNSIVDNYSQIHISACYEISFTPSDSVTL